jgi:glycosyltransferase involved in cell wall biosynthesis
VDGETGLLFPVGDVLALAEALARLISDRALARKMGHAGQERVMREFQQEKIWEALYREYLGLLQMKELPPSLRPNTGKSGSLVARSNE